MKIVERSNNIIGMNGPGFIIRIPFVAEFDNYHEIDDLVEKGKISDTEGRKICDDFFKSTGEKKEEFESKLKKVQDDLTERFDFMKKDKNGIEALNKRIEDLEAKVIAAEKKAAKAAAAVKKTVTKAAKK